MERIAHEIAQTGRDLHRALLVAALIFQAVVGSAHLAFAAAAPDGSGVPFICTVYSVAPLDTPGETPRTPDMPGARACPVCAHAHPLTGALLLPLASLPALPGRSFAAVRPARDQWPDDRQPALPNSRAPPRF